MSSDLDPNTPRWYRHKVTGKVGVYPPSLGENDPNLIPVEPNAKPLAYTPIPREAIEIVLASRTAQSGEADSSTPRKKKRSK